MIADELPDVAQEDAQGCQHPEAEGEDDQRHQDDGEENRRPGQVAVEEREGDQQYRNADGAVEKRCAHADDRQDFKGKDDFLDVVDIGQNQGGRTIGYVGKQAVDDHADEQHDGELSPRFVADRSPARVEDAREDEGVYGEHEHRIEERPDRAQGGASVAPGHFARDHPCDELAVAPQAARQGGERRGLLAWGFMPNESSPGSDLYAWRRRLAVR